jgi:proline-specific peptidase
MSSSISPSDVKEGTIPFTAPGLEKQCETWYKAIGPLSTPDKSSPIRPVVVVHGGPGLTHDYLKSIDELYVKFGIPVILYDQIGNGRSTHLQEKNGDAEFWSDELFEDELENLVQKLGLADNGYDILGHSWGGMMGSTFAARRPKGLRKLILSGAPALIDEWEKAYNEYLEEMDEDTKSAIKRGIEKEDWENEEYEAALMKFMSKHTVGSVWPQDMLDSFGWVKKDPTVALTM